MRKIALLLGTFLSAVSLQAKVYDVTTYGAVPDTTVLSTAAIQSAIDECSRSGGGVVNIPAGNYKIGTLVLKSHVNLHLELGATLFGSTHLKDYRKLKSDYVSFRTQGETLQLIYGDKVKDVEISGSGTIDGRGQWFPKLTMNDEGITRPHLLRFIQSQDITVEGITLRNSGCWMQHYLACDRVKIRGLRIYNRNNHNNDALDLDGCHEVVVSDLISDSEDDGITLKSTSPRLCENITVSNCIISSHCNAIKLGTETNGGFKNINIRGIVVKPSYNQEFQLVHQPIGSSGISLEIVDGGKMENVIISDINITGTRSPIFIRLGNRARGYYDGQVIDHVGSIKDVHLSNIIIREAGPYGCSITGLPGHPVEDITLSNISMEQKGGQKKIPVPQDEKEKNYPEASMWGPLPAKGFFVRHAKNVKFKDITVKTEEPDERPDFVEVDVK
ncbi:MAG: glycosyl hydrolase family 28 protein [Prevotella sp.]|nr:glycosyl hydrolase family 28 protein [Prevotella sp.]MCI2102338.1 glycosyl hydrolase family 28 protein [Prevotella sp.]